MTEKICQNCLCWDKDAGSEMGYCFRGGIAVDYTAADDSCQKWEENDMSETLKKCPFCGGQVGIDTISSNTSSEGIYMIECDGCGMATSFATADKGGGYCHATEDETIRAWNRRDEK